MSGTSDFLAAKVPVRMSVASEKISGAQAATVGRPSDAANGAGEGLDVARAHLIPEDCAPRQITERQASRRRLP